MGNDKDLKTNSDHTYTVTNLEGDRADPKTAMLDDTWQNRLDTELKRLGRGNAERRDYATAIAWMTQLVVAGRGPEDDEPKSCAGARMTVNISSTHVPAVCAGWASGDEKSYKNAYDLENEGGHTGEISANIGHRPGPASKINPRRKRIDAALPLPDGMSPQDIYYGALEVNGSGVRFYGDICLVLSADVITPATRILDRNSYDLMRSPIHERIKGGRPPSVSKHNAHTQGKKYSRSDQDKENGRLAQEAAKLAGWWGNDRGLVAAVKLLKVRGGGTRRLSTGQIADAILDDEDYIEVLKKGSFGSNDLQEVRIAAADAATDGYIARRTLFGPTPSGANLLWYDRRNAAQKALARIVPDLRVVTSRGRVK